MIGVDLCVRLWMLGRGFTRSGGIGDRTYAIGDRALTRPPPLFTDHSGVNHGLTPTLSLD